MHSKINEDIHESYHTTDKQRCIVRRWKELPTDNSHFRVQSKNSNVEFRWNIPWKAKENVTWVRSDIHSATHSERLPYHGWQSTAKSKFDNCRKSISIKEEKSTDINWSSLSSPAVIPKFRRWILQMCRIDRNRASYTTGEFWTVQDRVLLGKTFSECRKSSEWMKYTPLEAKELHSLMPAKL